MLRTRAGAVLSGGAGFEDLVGAGAQEAVEGELAGALVAEFEEEGGAVAPVGVDGVDEAEARGAVEGGAVGDGAQVDLQVVVGVLLGDDGDVADGAAGVGCARGEDEGDGCAEAELEGG